MKAAVMVGRVADFSESTASKIHKRSRLRRGNVVRRYTFSGRLSSPFWTIAKYCFEEYSRTSRAPLLLLAPLARNTIVLLYDLRRGLGKLPTYFFSSSSSSLSLFLLLSCFPLLLSPCFVYHRFTAVELRAAWWNFDRFPLAGLDKQARFLDDRTTVR